MTGKRAIAQLESAVNALPEAERALFDRIYHVTTDKASLVVPAPMAAFVQSRIVRIVDRGELNSSVSDIGGMELFGTSVVSGDPFLVAETLRRSVK